MNLSSVEKALSGIGNLRAASIVGGVVSAAALLGLHLSSGVQASGLIGVGAVIASVNLADSVIRSGHLKALPALVSLGAEDVEKATDNPLLDGLAQKVETYAAQIAALENRPTAPTVAQIIAALTGHAVAQVPVAPAPAVATPVPAVSIPSVPAPAVSIPPDSGSTTAVNPLAPVSS